MANETPEEKLAQTRARQAISQRYLNRDDNPDLDPDRQDQIDKNRIPGEPGGGEAAPLSPMSSGPARHLRSESSEVRETHAGRVSGGMSEAIQKSLREQPYATLVLAGLLGFVLGAVWKS